MEQLNYSIRQEQQQDYEAVEALVEAAFANEAYSDQREHLLVARLRQTEAFIPELSLVAEVNGEIVGHILLTKIEICDEDKRTPALALAPVSVHPNWQGKGIGGALIRAAHERAHALGHPIIILLGHADYYPRFGYQPTASFGISLPFEAPAENCMLVELEEGALEGVTGVVAYPPAFME